MFLFSFTHAGRTNYILGSGHHIPLSHLPDKVIPFLQSKKSLVIEQPSIIWKDIAQECKLIKDDQEDTTNIRCAIDIPMQTITCAKEINLQPLPQEIEERIESTAQKLFGVTVPRLSLKGLMTIIKIMTASDGMDACLKTQYIADNKKIYYLEDAKVTIHTFFDNSAIGPSHATPRYIRPLKTTCQRQAIS